MNAPDPNAFSLDINDSEDAELIEYFLGELPDRVDAINQASSSDDVEQLGRLAHQLKGAAPGFGFPLIGSAAAKLEGSIRALDQSEEDVNLVRAEVENLISLCQSYISQSKNSL
jgi:HPt (histidine-containing phosphotransfer) domain-containing protein